MKLSPNFTLEELTRSDVAVRNGISMHADRAVTLQLERLANEVLEPIRAGLSKHFRADTPIIVTSGYRPPSLNLLVGGARQSDHLGGRAADFYALGRKHRDVLPIVMELIDELPVAKCIDEFGSWIHVSIEELGRIPQRKRLVASRTATGVVYRDWTLDA